MYEILAEYYDEMMSADYDAWYSYLKTFGIKGKVLELGCGTGNFTSRLCKDGYSVTAVDLSAEMLNVASRKCGARRPLFIKADMQEFLPPTKVDTVLVACDGVNYLKEPSKLFSKVYSYLAPDGVFIFDISTEYKLRNVLADNVFYFESEKADLVWQNDCKKNKLDMRLVFFEKQQHSYIKREENQRMYIYTQDELQKALFSAGFKSVDVYGDMTATEPKKNSERIHFVVKKG